MYYRCEQDILEPETQMSAKVHQQHQRLISQGYVPPYWGETAFFSR